MEKLPIEIAANIFSRLPFDSVFQCKCVSKYWCNLLRHFIHGSDLYFATLYRTRLIDSSSSPDSVLLMLDQSSSVDSKETCVHRRHQLHYVEYNEEDQKGGGGGFNCNAVKKFNSPLKMVDSKFWTMATSSNGLICSVQTDHNNDDDSYLLYVCNPFLGQYVTLPADKQQQISSSSSMAFGFGHIPSTDEYKVVRIVYPSAGGGDEGNVEVYILGKSTHWRSKGNVNCRLQCDSPGVLVNGSIHWLIEKDETKKQNIIAFDLLEEEFREIPLPLGLQAKTNFKIKQLGGSLCGIDYVEEEREMIMWKFMEDYYLKNKEEEEDGSSKENEYWKSIFEIQWKGGRKGFEQYCFYWKKVDQSLLWMPNSSVVAVEHDVDGPKIDPKELKLARLFHGIPHIKSFVSLTALGENNAKTIKVIDRKRKRRYNDKDDEMNKNKNKNRKTKNLMKILFGRKPKKSKRGLTVI